MHARSLQKSRHFSSLVASLGFDAVAPDGRSRAVHAIDVVRTNPCDWMIL